MKATSMAAAVQPFLSRPVPPQSQQHLKQQQELIENLQVEHFRNDSQKRGWKGNNNNNNAAQLGPKDIDQITARCIGTVRLATPLAQSSSPSTNEFVCVASLISPKHIIAIIPKATLSMISAHSSSQLIFETSNHSAAIDIYCATLLPHEIDNTSSTTAGAARTMNLVIFSLQTRLDQKASYLGVTSFVDASTSLEPFDMYSKQSSVSIPTAKHQPYICDILNNNTIETALIDRDQTTIDDLLSLPVLYHDLQFGGWQLIAIVSSFAHSASSSSPRLFASLITPPLLEFIQQCFSNSNSNIQDHLSQNSMLILSSPSPQIQSQHIQLDKNQSAHRDGIYSLCRLNHRCVASSSVDKSIRIWDYLNNQLIFSLDCDGCCRYFVSSANILIGTSENYVVLVDWQDKKITAVVPCKNKLYSLLESPISSSILAGDCQGNINVITNGKITHCIRCREDSNPTGHRGSVNVMCVVKSQPKLFFSAGECGEIKAWNAQSYSLHANLSGHDAEKSIYYLESCMRDTKEILISGSSDRTIRLWDTQSFQQIRLIELSNAIYAACLVSEREIMIGDGEVVRILDFEDASSTLTLSKQHKSRVNACTKLSPNTFASADIEGNVVIWQVLGSKTQPTQFVAQSIKQQTQLTPQQSSKISSIKQQPKNLRIEGEILPLTHDIQPKATYNDKSPLAYKQQQVAQYNQGDEANSSSLAKRNLFFAPGQSSSQVISPPSVQTIDSSTRNHRGNGSQMTYNNNSTAPAATMNDTISQHNNNYNNLIGDSLNRTSLNQSSFIDLIRNFDDNDKYLMMHHKKSMSTTPTTLKQLNEQADMLHDLQSESSRKFQRNSTKNSDLRDLQLHYDSLIESYLSTKNKSSIAPKKVAGTSLSPMNNHRSISPSIAGSTKHSRIQFPSTSSNTTPTATQYLKSNPNRASSSNKGENGNIEVATPKSRTHPPALLIPHEIPPKQYQQQQQLQYYQQDSTPTSQINSIQSNFLGKISSSGGGGGNSNNPVNSTEQLHQQQQSAASTAEPTSKQSISKNGRQIQLSIEIQDPSVSSGISPKSLLSTSNLLHEQTTQSTQQYTQFQYQQPLPTPKRSNTINRNFADLTGGISTDAKETVRSEQQPVISGSTAAATRISELEEENRLLVEETKAQSVQIKKYQKQIETLIQTLSTSEEERMSIVKEIQQIAPQLQAFSELAGSLKSKDVERQELVKKYEQEIADLKNQVSGLQKDLNAIKKEPSPSSVHQAITTHSTKDAQFNSAYPVDDQPQQQQQNNRHLDNKGRPIAVSDLRQFSSKNGAFSKEKVMQELRVLQSEALELQQDIVNLKQATMECETEESMKSLLNKLQRTHTLYQHKNDQISDMKALYALY